MATKGKQSRKSEHEDLAFRFLAAGAQCAREAAKEIKAMPYQWGDEMAEELEQIARHLEGIQVRMEMDA